jgi:hypothetical protein
VTLLRKAGARYTLTDAGAQVLVFATELKEKGDAIIRAVTDFLVELFGRDAALFSGQRALPP